MRIKEGFRLMDVCGNSVIVSEGIKNIDFNKIISLNETSAYLWKALEGKDFTFDDMAELLIAEYEVDKETALADSEKLANEWIKIGIVEVA
ncbi:MAG: PqqD family protein [Bacteroidaceae bacterium]|nr:PqqD family protein [Bacteroidaceae bacterium]